ncbi:MAG: 3-deoxy-D-manno-octulosonic acid transferase [Rhodospirillales bacterium]|nr:3-deoxy-D-manno-octulosonic acid transferase [Rhodospirillales bacterium]
MIAAVGGLATTLAAPALRAWLRRRAALGKEIPARLAERWGEDASPRPRGPLLWLHAASIGESSSMRRVLLLLPPELNVLFTTGTVTSATMLAKEFAGDARRLHRFVPLDVPAWVARFLDHWRPDAACFVESEIWPSMLHQLHKRNIPVGLVNARLSARSFARWRLVKPLARPLFAGFAAVQAQSRGDASRLVAMGAPAPGIVGNLKLAAFPLPVDALALARLRQQIQGRPCWLAASTHPGEEAIVAAVHGHLRAEFPDLLTIIVPRHPERGPAILAGLPRPATRRGADDAPPPAGPTGAFYVADTLGELGLFYRVAACAFVGKSLAVGGGQNPLEPARLGCPVAMGPMTANFADEVAMLRDAGALTQVADAAALADFVAAMLRDPARRRTMGEAGKAAAAGEDELPARVAALMAGLAGWRGQGAGT